MLCDRVLQPARSEVERLVPGRLAESALALGARTDERVQEPLRGVHALEVVGDLAAQESGGDRVFGVALDARGAARGVDRDEQGARIGTVVRAGPADDSGSGAHGDFDPTREAGYPAGTSRFPRQIA